MTSIGSIFGSLPAQINDALEPLEKPVSSGYTKDASLDSGNKTLQLFGTPIAIDAVLSAGVAAGNTNLPDPFGDGSLVAISGKTYTSLTVKGTTSASGSAPGAAGNVQCRRTRRRMLRSRTGITCRWPTPRI